MMIIRARLIKHATEDGLMEVWEKVPLGRIYYIDLSTKRKVKYLHKATGKLHEKVVVKASDPLDSPDMLDFPYECLELLRD